MDIQLPPVNEDPRDADIHFLEDQINDYNLATMGVADGRILSFFVRDERGGIVAGLYGWTWGGTCEVRYLWVDQKLRGRGYGTALMAQAEREAIMRGCHQMVLDTHSPRALGLYRKLGFEISATHPDYPRGHQKYYLRKRLAKAPD